jgi:hypothetical protein
LRHNENTYLALIETGFLYDSSQARKEVLLKIPMVNKFSYEMSIFPLAKPVLAFAASVRSRQVPANPFFLHSKLVELPLTGPGDWQLILSNRGPMFPPSRSGRIADIWLDILRDIQHKEGQMFVVQSHPYIVSPGYLKAIDVFLESVINDEMVEFKTLGEVTTQFLSRQELPVGHQISLEEV